MVNATEETYRRADLDTQESNVNLHNKVFEDRKLRHIDNF